MAWPLSKRIPGVGRSITVQRSDMKVYEDVVHRVPLTDLRNATGLILTATEAAGGFNLAVSSHVLVAQAEITDNETEASACRFSYILPSNYVPGAAITVRLGVQLVKTGSPTDNGSTIDIAVYKQDAQAVGSDLCTTAAQTFAALDTVYDKDFVITPTGLVPGDILHVEVASNVIDSEAGGGTIRLQMGTPKIIHDEYA